MKGASGKQVLRGGKWIKRVKGAEEKRRSGASRHALSLPDELDHDQASGRATPAKGKLAKKRKFQEADEVLEARVSSKILSQARKQQQEIARDLERETGREATRQAFDMAAAVVAASERRGTAGMNSRRGAREGEGAASSDEDDEGDDGGALGLHAGRGGERGEEEEEGEGEEEGIAKAMEKAVLEGEGEPVEDAKGAKGEVGVKGAKGKTTAEDEEEQAEEEGETASDYQEFGHDVTEEDERAIALFLAPSAEAPRQQTLADVIRAKIVSAAEGQDRAEGPAGVPDLPPEMRSKVEAVYRGVGDILSRYTAGKVPKAFKLIPALSNWEEVLHLTAPERWSAPAMLAATRLFASNLNSRMAQRFFRLVLLPRVRGDIRQHRRLHFALYMSLKKALYKPAAFFKGVLLPVCQSRTCSLREAVILGSVIQKVSIPVLHSSVALMRIAEMPYAGTSSYFMKLFFDKKYALPYRVVDAVVAHYMRFLEDQRVLPVIWHQSLLSFVQRYKNELTAEQKRDIRSLLSSQHHYLMTPEIQRELSCSTRSRGDKEEMRDVQMVVASGSQGGSKKQKMDEDFRSLPVVEMGMDED